MQSLPIVENCDDCGACCMHMGTPPFMGHFWQEGREPERWAASMYGPDGDPSIDDDDWQRLHAAPTEAFEVYRATLHGPSSDGMPCCWFDQQTKRCRFHEFRPEICRQFEVGSEACLSHRRDRGIVGSDDEQRKTDYWAKKRARKERVQIVRVLRNKSW